jgi:uncharacterized protein (DUF1501 family)
MTAGELSRRRFLQGTGAAGLAALLPTWAVNAALAATPIGPTDGVLVHLTLDGGNDGLNTFVPTANGAYYDARRHLAISPQQAIGLTPTRGLHPDLVYLKQLWNHGRVAIVEGVGQPAADLSHFLSTDAMMSANSSGLPGNSGWLGRVLDDIPHQPLNGLSIGSTVPLLLQGNSTRGNSIPVRPGLLHSLDRNDWSTGPRYDALVARSSTSTGLGPLADRATSIFGDAIEMATDLQPHLPSADTEPGLVTRMRLAAQLINANVGVRVLSIVYGDFDTHANQLTRHGALLRELDDALRVFFTTISPAMAGQVVVLGTSEFGRRVRANANGTDHGTANSMFAIGTPVKGGFYGEAPSLTALDRWGNMGHTVDYRQVFGNVASTILGADATQIVGADYPDLGFLNRLASSRHEPISFPGVPTTRRAMQGELIRLYLAYFERRPDEAGLDYWTGVREAGRSLTQISTEFAASAEFRARYGTLSNQQFIDLAYRNVLDRSADAGGAAHWHSVLSRGGSRGDVMVGLAESSEFKRKSAAEIAEIESSGPVGRLYRAYFLREPDTVGLDYWINTRLDRALVSEQFAQSAEFRNRYGSLDDQQFVTMAYRNVLGREPDPAGLAHWVGTLARGVSRGRVMLGFSDSAEFVRKVQHQG